MSSKRDLGELGENVLRTWASQRSFSATKAGPDKTGWDFLVEVTWDPDPEQPNPFELARFGVECLIQVKSTDGPEKKFVVKLSNAIRFAQSHLPCFFLRIHFSDKDTPQAAYLIHFGKDHARRALKRKLKLDLDQDSDHHKRTFSIAYHEPDRLESLNGIALEKAILSHVSNGPSAYARSKIDFVNTVGRGNGQSIVKFSVTSPPAENDPREQLVDLALGLRETIEVHNMGIFDQRFGFTSETPRISLETGHISIIDIEPVDEISLVFKSADHMREETLRTDLIVPAGLGDILDRESMKVRFVSPFVSVVLPLGKRPKMTFQFKEIDPEEEYLLEDLNAAMRVTSLLIEAADSGDTASIEIRNKSGVMSSGKLDLDGTTVPRFHPALQCVFWAWDIARLFEIEREVKMSLAHLVSQIESLRLARVMSGPEQRSVTVTMQDLGEYGDVIFCVPLSYELALGAYVVMAVFSAWGRPTLQSEDSQLLLQTTDIRMECKYKHRKEDSSHTTLQDLIKEVVDKHESEMTYVVTLKSVNED